MPQQTHNLSVLKLRAETLELATLQYEIAEKDFINGTIDSGALSVEKQRQSVALEAYEKSKFEVTKSLLILEVITRTPFYEIRNTMDYILYIFRALYRKMWWIILGTALVTGW